MISKARTAEEELAGHNPEALRADGFDAAIIGYSVNHAQQVLVYDADACLDILEADGMTAEEAVEWMEFNTLSAYVGPDGPLFVRLV